jgi:hypothetical protein
MKMIKTTATAIVLSALSFGAFAAQPAQPVADRALTAQRASDVEAGSNIMPGALSTGQTMDQAFDVHTLVAGDWS